MRVLLLFLDGIGLGDDDPTVNPFAVAHMPHLTALTNGHRWLRTIGKQEHTRATFIPTDPRMGVSGRPQSGTGQAAILTGLNVPQRIGEHYGPKPNAATRDILAHDNLFKQVVGAGKRAALLDAYPDGLHHDIARGKTLRSSIQLAAHEAGLPLFGIQDLLDRRALTPEWTGKSWHDYLKLYDTPVYTPFEAGQQLVRLANDYDFAMHSHWMTDHVGHRGPLTLGVELLELFDGVMAGVLDSWPDEEGVVIITSDHGNLEDISSRNHTENDVPTLIIGNARHQVAEKLRTLADITPAILRLLQIEPQPLVESPIHN
jgi:2,3-bisphosphoglycerate-independent phosphoglycerate mutase